MHHQHPVGDISHHAHVVRDEQHGCAAVLLQLFDEFQYLLLGGHVQRRGRLVANQQGGFEHHGDGNHDALALPAAELVRETVDHAFGFGQAHLLHDLQHGLTALGGRPIGVTAQYLVDLFTAAHHRVQCGHRLLKHHAHGTPAQAAHALFACAQ